MSDHVEELAQAITHHFSCMDEARAAARDVVAAGWVSPEVVANLRREARRAHERVDAFLAERGELP